MEQDPGLNMMRGRVKKDWSWVLVQDILFPSSKNKQQNFSMKTNCTFPLFGILLELPHFLLVIFLGNAASLRDYHNLTNSVECWQKPREENLVLTYA